MRGPTVRLLVRGHQGDKALHQETIALINDLAQRNISLEACGYVLNLFGVEPEDLYAGIHAVGNSLNSLVGYQTKGYALATCRTNHELPTNSPVWPIFQLLFDQ
jgi:intracellular sulfur oxidation DsrE/DsrF family protein